MQTFTATTALKYQRPIVAKDALGFSLFFSSGGEGEAEVKGRRPDFRSPRKQPRVSFQSFGALFVSRSEHTEGPFADGADAGSKTASSQQVVDGSRNMVKTSSEAINIGELDVRSIRCAEVSFASAGSESSSLPHSSALPVYDGTFVFGTRWRVDSYMREEADREVPSANPPSSRAPSRQDPSESLDGAADSLNQIDPHIPSPSLGGVGSEDFEDADQKVIRAVMFLITTTLKSIPTAKLSDKILVARRFLQAYLPTFDHDAIVASLPLSSPPRVRRHIKWSKRIASHAVVLSPVVEFQEIPECSNTIFVEVCLG
ncbi:hypothetical protein BKA70DRAFT_1262509 [Coprinopsis sp. MPI-PUGE-AT-0042]|nr:hypothetical protein BKA70DRAFT_1262509 [Coprinopsis sp. MPI-PUGE-AT-0042]